MLCCEGVGDDNIVGSRVVGGDGAASMELATNYNQIVKKTYMPL